MCSLNYLLRRWLCPKVSLKHWVYGYLLISQIVAAARSFSFDWWLQLQAALRESRVECRELLLSVSMCDVCGLNRFVDRALKTDKKWYTHTGKGTQEFSNFAMCQLSAWKLFIFVYSPARCLPIDGVYFVCAHTRHKWYFVADTFAVIWICCKENSLYDTYSTVYSSLAVRKIIKEKKIIKI